jgi:hypothetical protein
MRYFQSFTDASVTLQGQQANMELGLQVLPKEMILEKACDHSRTGATLEIL